MDRFFVLAIAAAMGTMLAPQVQAVQVDSMAARGSLVTLVRDGCGEGFFRGDDGNCRPEHRHPVAAILGGIFNGGHDEPQEHRRVCPEGYHMGANSGVCKPGER